MCNVVVDMCILFSLHLKYCVCSLRASPLPDPVLCTCGRCLAALGHLSSAGVLAFAAFGGSVPRIVVPPGVPRPVAVPATEFILSMYVSKEWIQLWWGEPLRIVSAYESRISTRQSQYSRPTSTTTQGFTSPGPILRHPPLCTPSFPSSSPPPSGAAPPTAPLAEHPTGQVPRQCRAGGGEEGANQA